MAKWETAAHFASWLALCPDNDITGGRVVYTRVRKVNNRAGQMFRLAAHSLHHSQTPLGGYLRRMKAKLGPAAATTATAHKIAVIFYTMVKDHVETTRRSGPPEMPNVNSARPPDSGVERRAAAINSCPSPRRPLCNITAGSLRA
jgi:hypothetical protein